MQSMQTKILAALSTTASEAGLDPVQQSTWANTGNVLMQDGFDTVLRISYNFQSTYCTLELAGPAVRALGLRDNPPAYRADQDGTVTYHSLKYEDSEHVKAMLALVTDMLATKDRASIEQRMLALLCATHRLPEDPAKKVIEIASLVLLHAATNDVGWQRNTRDWDMEVRVTTEKDDETSGFHVGLYDRDRGALDPSRGFVACTQFSDVAFVGVESAEDPHEVTLLPLHDVRCIEFEQL